jgi:hypothetical protein
VEAFRVALISATALLAVNLNAQSTSSTWIAGLLPPEAKVIETADVKIGRRVDRSLVLWMLHPERVVRQKSGEGGCAEWVYGDHWYGPARLSLLDLTNKRLINTVQIQGMYEGTEEKDPGFPIPFLVQNGVYYVPHISEKEEGAPIILNLKDLTGEGVAGQFALFECEVCGINLTSALGYSPKSDRAVQYGVDAITVSGKPGPALWAEQVFGAKPVRPGHWDFTWAPGHGVDDVVHERVSFNREQQIFVRK